jgi:hypothetical protein
MLFFVRLSLLYKDTKKPLPVLPRRREGAKGLKDAGGLNVYSTLCVRRHAERGRSLCAGHTNSCSTSLLRKKDVSVCLVSFFTDPFPEEPY